MLKDRVIGLRRVRAGDLIPNPKNWRTHPKAQQDAMKGVLAEIGMADALLVRETPDGLMLIDGHLRADIISDEQVPVLVLDLDEAEADMLLATLDPLAAMAEASRGKLEELLNSLQSSGTTMVAAEQLGRICYALEIEPKYVAVCLERLSKMGLGASLINGPN